MIFPWMFDEIHALKPFKAAADLLAKKEDWPPLYDVPRLQNNKVCFRILIVLSYGSNNFTLFHMISFCRCLLLQRFTTKICM